MRSASACSSMSSQTHPQNVQVAFLTTVNSIIHLRYAASGESVVLVGETVRTGRRNDEASPQRQPAATAADAAGHEPPGFELFPGRDFSGGWLVRSGFLGVLSFVVIVHVRLARFFETSL